jgi:hypothetical protein
MGGLGFALWNLIFEWTSEYLGYSFSFVFQEHHSVLKLLQQSIIKRSVKTPDFMYLPFQSFFISEK